MSDQRPDLDALRAMIDAGTAGRLLVPRGRRRGLDGIERQVLAVIVLEPGRQGPALARRLAMSDQRVRAATARLRAAKLVTYTRADGYVATSQGGKLAARLASDVREAMQQLKDVVGR